MLRWIEKTRNKPKHVRDQYAFLGALLVTGLIGALWVFSLPAHFAEIDAESEEAEVETPAEDDGRSFTDVFGEITDNFAAVIGSSDAEPATTTDSEAPTTSATSGAVEVPVLSEENTEQIQVSQPTSTSPEPRRVLISTTTRATSSGDTE